MLQVPGEISKGKLSPQLKFVCSQCLDKLFKASVTAPRKNTGIESVFDELFGKSKKF